MHRVAGTALPWLAPAAALVLGLIAFPIVLAIVASVSTQSLVGTLTGWAGLANFQRILADPEFWDVLRNTVLWTAWVVGLTTLTGLGLALLLDADWWGKRALRFALIIPWATSLAISSVIWKRMLDSQYGTINLLLQAAGLIHQPIAWLSKPSTSLPVMIVVGVMVSIPFTAFVLLAGLRTIPHELTEAAATMGAGYVKKTWYITLPLLRPFISLTVLLNVVWVFNSFPIIWILTNGGPASQTDILITYLYKKAFALTDVTGASAVAVFGFTALLAIGLLYWRLVQRDPGDL